jgi:hypothetical protein
MPKNKPAKKSGPSKEEKEKEKEQEQEQQEDKVPEKIPDEFFKIINDFTQDISITFPEYTPIINKWWLTNAANTGAEGLTQEEQDQRCAALLEEKEAKTKKVFLHCLRVIPERFFDILYQNDKMFEEGSDINTEFLPGIIFKYLWTCDISQTTRATIWKYLQLMLFSIINSVKSSDDFGDSAKLFEAINENELKSKLEETLNHVQDMFNFSGQKEGEGEGEGEGGEDNEEDSQPNEGAKGTKEMPSAENIQEHIQKMMQGKLGKFAMELAEETAGELNLDMDNEGSANDVFQKLFKNPGKLMSIVKNLGSKLDEKIKSGELKESELISESMEMLNNMKNMPGMNNMHEILSKMGMPGMAKGGKVNMNAMESQMQKNLKMAQMKERMKKKATAAAAPVQTQPTPKPSSAPGLTDEQLFTIFSKGDKVERTPRGAKPPSAQVTPAQVTPAQVTPAQVTPAQVTPAQVTETVDTVVPPVIKEKKKDKRKK